MFKWFIGIIIGYILVQVGIFIKLLKGGGKSHE